jgi:hypothetical protein|tara:strand:+ start:59 stop:211 length:153 start_codon:yes stop_codon:yes gene_type:complete
MKHTNTEIAQGITFPSISLTGEVSRISANSPIGLGAGYLSLRNITTDTIK